MIFIETDNTSRVVRFISDAERLNPNVINLGYLVDSIPRPEYVEDKLPVMYYRNGTIEYEYEDVPPTPEPEPIPEPESFYEDQVVALIRERYSADDELAILRQRDTKPEEFEQYFHYCEECKAAVKQKLGML